MSVFNTPKSVERVPHDDCAICKEQLRPEGQDIDLSNLTAEEGTDHTFCLGCLQQWKDRQPTCPTCRSRITSINGERVGPAAHVDPDDDFVQEALEARAQAHDLMSSPPMRALKIVIVGWMVGSLLQVAAVTYLTYGLYRSIFS